MPHDGRPLPRSRWLRTVLFHLGGPMCRRLFPLHVEGEEHLPAAGAAIIAANHLSFFDSIVLALAVPRPLKFVGKAEYLEHWPTRRLFPALGMIPVERGSPPPGVRRSASGGPGAGGRRAVRRLSRRHPLAGRLAAGGPQRRGPPQRDHRCVDHPRRHRRHRPHPTEGRPAAPARSGGRPCASAPPSTRTATTAAAASAAGASPRRDVRHRRAVGAGRPRRRRAHGSMSTPGLRMPPGSTACFAARSASANSSGAAGRTAGGACGPTAWWWVIVPPASSDRLGGGGLHLAPHGDLRALPAHPRPRVVRRRAVGVHVGEAARQHRLVRRRPRAARRTPARARRRRTPASGPR